MAVLKKDISAFERMRADLEHKHANEWVVFHDGVLAGVFADFEEAATMAIETFDEGPYLIRQVGAEQVALPGGMIFTPAHYLG
jgi:hypothetical protein